MAKEKSIVDLARDPLLDPPHVGGRAVRSRATPVTLDPAFESSIRDGSRSGARLGLLLAIVGFILLNRMFTATMYFLVFIVMFGYWLNDIRNTMALSADGSKRKIGLFTGVWSALFRTSFFFIVYVGLTLIFQSFVFPIPSIGIIIAVSLLYATGVVVSTIPAMKIMVKTGKAMANAARENARARSSGTKD